MDSFDILAEKAREASRPPEKEQPAKQSAEEWREAFCRLATGRWCSFLHPVHGKVAGYCEKAEFAGYSEPWHVPDFRLLVVGRAVKRNEISVSLVESRAQFFDCEQDALDDCKTTTTTESK